METLVFAGHAAQANPDIVFHILPGSGRTLWYAEIKRPKIPFWLYHLNASNRTLLQAATDGMALM